MGLTDILKAWRDYPINIAESFHEDPTLGNLAHNLGKSLLYKLSEGAALGGMGYYFTEDQNMFLYGIAAVVIGRNLQLLNYSANRKEK